MGAPAGVLSKRRHIEVIVWIRRRRPGTGGGSLLPNPRRLGLEEPQLWSTPRIYDGVASAARHHLAGLGPVQPANPIVGM